MEPNKKNNDKPNANENEGDRDYRLSGPSGAATGAGERAGRARGAAVGGAMGQAIGAGRDVAAGAVAGGLAAGKNAARNKGTESFNPNAEHEFWREEYKDRPYVTDDTPYEQYGPAFQYGWECCSKHQGETFEEVEPQMERDWERHRGQSKLGWNSVRNAARDAWQRVEEFFDR